MTSRLLITKQLFRAYFAARRREFLVRNDRRRYATYVTRNGLVENRATAYCGRSEQRHI